MTYFIYWWLVGIISVIISQVVYWYEGSPIRVEDLFTGFFASFLGPIVTISLFMRLLDSDVMKIVIVKAKKQ